MMKVLSVLLFVLQWNIDFAEEYVITRQYKDKFEIPRHDCTSEWKQACVEMNGIIQIRQTKCFCVCHKDGNKDNVRNVFGFFYAKWQCALNTDVRRNYSECYDGGHIHLNGRDDDQPLLPVPISNQPRGTFTDIYASICNLVHAMSYLDCNSVWQSLPQHSSSVGFFSEFSNNMFSLYDKGRDAFNNYNPKIDGYIIKLGVRCQYHYDDGNWDYTDYCILLKVKGKVNCTINLPTTSPPTSTSIPTTKDTTTAAASSTTTTRTSPSTKESSSSRHSTTTSSATTSSSTQSFSLIPSTSNALSTLFIPKLSSEAPSSKTGIPIITTQISIPKNSTNSPLKGGDGETADQSAIIAGPIVGVTALITIVIILIIVRVWMKRKKREACDGVAQNPVYDGVVPSNSSERPGQQTSTDDEYSYAYTNTHPVVIRDQHGKALQGPHFPNGHVGDPSSSDFPIYNTLEDPDYAALSKTQDTNSGPSYNVLERRPEANWNTTHSALGSSPNSEAPVYNTLEDRDYAKLSKTKDSQSGPSYNILERRPNANWNKQKGPLYDVVEKTNSASGSSPNSEAPIYNTLEDPDYAKLGESDNIRIGPSYDILEGPEDKRAMTQGSLFYDVLENPNSTGSPLYDVLEEPESDEQHVYGSLQNNDPHIYGALQSPTSHNEKENSGYDDDYNFAGDVIHYDGDGDVYQELNQDRQRSSDDVYEPLHHSRVLIGMKDMNEKPQSRA